MTADAFVAEQVVLHLFRAKKSKRALAEQLGISEQSAGKKINGHSTFSLDELLLVAQFFGVPVTELLPGQDYDPVRGRGRSRGPRGTRTLQPAVWKQNGPDLRPENWVLAA